MGDVQWGFINAIYRRSQIFFQQKNGSFFVLNEELRSSCDCPQEIFSPKKTITFTCMHALSIRQHWKSTDYQKKLTKMIEISLFSTISTVYYFDDSIICITQSIITYVGYQYPS